MTEKSNQSLTKRGFNLPHVFDRNVIILLIVYAIVLFLQLTNTDSDGYFYYSVDYPRGFNNLSGITFLAGLIISFVQFRFLQVKTKCLTILSFGESRKSLFRKKFWFPLICMVLITVCYYFVLLCALKRLQRNFLMLADEYFANILISLLPLLVGYVVGAFSRIVSGKTSETIVFGASVCILPFSVFSFVDSIFALSLNGYYVKTSNFGLLNYSSVEGHPITTVFSLFDPLYTLNANVMGFGNRNNDASMLDWFQTPMFYIIKNLVWIFLIVVAVFFIEKLFVKSFKAENCNKSGKNKKVRLICSVALSLFACVVITQGVYEYCNAEVQSFAMLPLLLITLILALIVTVVITSVLYRKKEQLNFSFLGAGATAAFGITVYLISVTGCFGYSTYIPETYEIKSVVVNDPVGFLGAYSSEYVYPAYEELYVDMCFKTKEEIEKVKDIHNFIANDKNYDTNETFTIIYELENGKFVHRSYTYLSEEACERISTLYETDAVRDFYKTIFNQKPEINGESSDSVWAEWDKNWIFNNNEELFDYIYGYEEKYYDYHEYWTDDTSYMKVADADSLVIYSKDNKCTYITEEQISRENMEDLKKALFEDYTSLSWQQFFKPEKQIGVISLASCKALKESEQNWLNDGDYQSTSEQLLREKEGWLYRFSVTSDMLKTIEVLKKAGLYEHFDVKLEVSEAHLIDSSDFISWVYSYSNIEGNKSKDRNGEYLSSLVYSWDNGGYIDVYLDKGCDYIDISLENYNDLMFEDWYELEVVYEPIPESYIEKITPEEAEKLREKAFMTYNAGNDCKFLVMKYTDGTANMLVIPN